MQSSHPVLEPVPLSVQQGNNMTLKSIFAAACLLAMTTVGSQAEPYIATDDLKGTI